MENEELQPCPFCGGYAELKTGRSRVYGKAYFVECQNCYIRTDRWGQEAPLGPQYAIEFWNARSSSAALSVLPEASAALRILLPVLQRKADAGPCMHDMLTRAQFVALYAQVRAALAAAGGE